jgi:xanthine dehydrogenase accessory factor
MTNTRKTDLADAKSDERFPVYRLSRDFIEFFATHRSSGQPLALVAVTQTEGSSYSKAGHLVLLDQVGRFAGLVSGGCLENDLAHRATRVLERNERAFVDYDLRNDDDVFGLGVGCDGVIHLVIEPLSRGNGYEPLASLIDRLADSTCADITLPGDANENHAPACFRLFRPATILVLGAGPDALPFLHMIDALGWNATVNDHRQHYVDGLRPPQSIAIHCGPAGDIVRRVDLARFDAAIVMSHNLAADRAYLGALARSELGFIGLLGPAHRRERLLDDLGAETACLLEGRLRAPVGRRIGGRGPAAIALEIAAELQEYICSLESA